MYDDGMLDKFTHAHTKIKSYIIIILFALYSYNQVLYVNQCFFNIIKVRKGNLPKLSCNTVSPKFICYYPSMRYNYI